MSKGIVLALGFFDGVHVGHRALLRRAADLAEAHCAEPHALSFHNHPRSLFGEQTPLIDSAELRRALIAEIIPQADFLPFTRELAALRPEDFVLLLQKMFPSLLGVAVGYNYSFGRGGSGDAALLARLCGERGLFTETVPPVLYGGETVSSTRVRGALAAGDIALAIALLGRPPMLQGCVVHGKGLGHTLGFATANFVLSGIALPKSGVYISTAKTEGGPEMPSVTNISDCGTVETHLLDANESLYGQQLRVSLLQFLRPMQAFAQLDSLTRQVRHDISVAAEFFGHSM